ncbi:Holliday junction resolvase RuvX [Patescibacteria group bacterium]|nr:MAG: Holliday junction resolvase RuvX [Patescibacteria group bacterium]
MKYLGIDYGTKRVGIAVSDETGKFAFAKAVLANDKSLLSTIHKICIDEKVEAIVLGESKDYDGKDNPLMKQITKHKGELETEVGVPVYLEPEFMTSAAAERMGEKDSSQNRRSGLSTRSLKAKNEMLDASAAALILQSYLDRH